MRRGTWLAVAVVAGAALSPAVIDLRGGRPASPPRVAPRPIRSGPLLAGAGRAEVELPPGVPLAGYRPFGREAAGSPSPTHVRALLLEVAGLRVAIVLAELLSMPATLAASIRAQALEEGASCTAVVATHTHTGPGAYDPDLLPQAVAVGRHDPRVGAALLAASSSALAAAEADLSMAQLSSGEAPAPELVDNRDRRGAPADDRLTVLVLDRPDGTPVARLARLAAHPTLAGRSSGISGDWPARVMGRFEEQGGVALVVQGAVGDAAAKPGDAADRVPAFADRVLARARAVPLVEVGPPVALGCSEVEFDLPAAQAGTAVPWALRTLTSNLLAPLAPRTARLTAVRLDDLALLFEPAEPTRAAASRTAGVLAAAGLRARAVSLAEGYVGYAPLAEDFAARTFSTRYAWFGPALADRLDEAGVAAARAISPPADGFPWPPSPSAGPAPGAALPRR